MDVNKIRLDFNLLSKYQDKIYFDNACNTLRPISVIEAMNEYYLEHPTCAGRSAYKLAEITTNKVEESRKLVANFIGAKKKEEVIFTRNTTESLNLVANSLNLKTGDVVLTTNKEHNSNLIPWLKLVKKIGIVHKVVETNQDNTFNFDNYKSLLEEGNVKLVSFGLTSNLDGYTLPAEEIVREAHKQNSLVMFDAAQAIPHHKINVSKLDIDFLAFSGAKMLGPSGIGVLYGKLSQLEKLDTFLLGGDTVESSTYSSYDLKPLPERFEAGLQNYAGIIGLGGAVKYLEVIGLENIHKQEVELNKIITDGLRAEEKIEIIGPENPEDRGGIFSFYIKGMDSHQAAITLDSAYGIMVRSGQHCVHSWFNARGITNSIRASLYFYNTKEEAEKFVDAIKKICNLI